MVVRASLAAISLVAMTFSFGAPPVGACHESYDGCLTECPNEPQDGSGGSSCRDANHAIGEAKDVLMKGGAKPGQSSAAFGGAGAAGYVFFTFEWNTTDGAAPPGRSSVPLRIEFEEGGRVDWDASATNDVTYSASATSPETHTFGFEVKDAPRTPGTTATSTTATSSTATTTASATGSTSASTTSTSSASTTSSSSSSSGGISFTFTGGPPGSGLRAKGTSQSTHVHIPYTIIANFGMADEERVTGVFTFGTDHEHDNVGFRDLFERYWQAAAFVLVVGFALGLLVARIRLATVAPAPLPHRT